MFFNSRIPRLLLFGFGALLMLVGSQSQSVGMEDSLQQEQQSGSDKKESGSDTKTAAMMDKTKSMAGKDGFDVMVAKDGVLKFRAPASWDKVKPRNRFVEFEISVPKSEGEADDAENGRLTISGARGSVEDNVNRWLGQYKQPDGSQTSDNSTVTKSQVAGCDVTWVDIKGTLMDRPGGPMAGGKVIERSNYRMLGSIVQAKEHGQYFLKLYGPAKTIGDNEAAFKAFVESLVIGKEDEGGFDVSVAKGGLNFKAPAAWEKVKPRNRFVEYEISIPKSEGEADDAKNGRLTLTAAMGTVEQNIDRWYGQYKQPDGSKTSENSTVTETKVAGCEVMWVDIKGTLMDRVGPPMAGGKIVDRENYRMLASIIQAGEHGQYFVKLYGPAKTIGDHEAAFKAFVESLVINDEAKGM